MFDYSELDNKELIKSEDATRILENLSSGQIVYIKNSKSEDYYKITFTKINQSSFKASLEYGLIDKNKEVKILTNGKISILVFKEIITMKFENNTDLHIIASDSLLIYK